MRRPFVHLRWGTHAACVVALAFLLVACGGAKPATATPAATTTATVLPAAQAQATAQTKATPTAQSSQASASTPTRTASAATTNPAVPAKAYETLRYVEAHNGDPPPNYQGGTTFENRERRLPNGQYKEYDVDPRGRGGRNAERIVINQSSGQAYYTGDHYDTFIPISSGR